MTRSKYSLCIKRRILNLDCFTTMALSLIYWTVHISADCTGNDTTFSLCPASTDFDSECLETYLTIAVDNHLEVMYFDGTLVPGSNQSSVKWSKSSVFALPANVTVIALKATNAEIYFYAGILASDTFGNILTNSNWKCTPIAAVNSSEWMMLSYSDASWPPAVTNGANLPSTSPWGQDTNISADAQWIWTTSQPTSDQFIYCRLTITVARQDSIQPRFGPVAGGTVVNVTGYWPYLASSYAINFVNINQSTSQTMSIFNEELISFVTEPVSDIGIWTICITFNGISVTKTINLFEYRRNPVISGITPQNQSLAGGTRMTVHGTNLNSVAFPVIRALVTIVTPDLLHPGEPSDVLQLNDSSQICSVNESTSDQMICLTPALNLPLDFINFQNALNDISGNAGQSTSARKRREAAAQTVLSRQKRVMLYSVSQINGPNGSVANVVITFDFDGYQRYQNGTDIPPLNFLLPNIRIDPGPEILFFNPITDKDIVIKGDSFTSVGSKEDFLILIGISPWTIIALTSNQLTCVPPKTVPMKGSNNTCPTGQFDVVVYFVKTPFFYTCLQYDPMGPVGLEISALAGGLSGLAVVITIIIAVVVLLRQRRKHNRPRPSHAKDGPTRIKVSKMSSILPPNRDSHDGRKVYEFESRYSRPESGAYGRDFGENLSDDIKNERDEQTARASHTST